MNFVTAERGVSMFDVQIKGEMGNILSVFERVTDLRFRDNLLFLKGLDIDGKDWSHATTVAKGLKININLVHDYD